MRIAHVIRRLSFDDWGGTEQVVWNLAKAQAKAGHEVRLFATTALWRGLSTKSAKATRKSICPLCFLRPTRRHDVEVVDGIEIVRFDAVYPWWPMSARLVAELDRKGGNPFVPGLGRAIVDWKPDVIHCHAMARIAELCLRTAGKCGAKCVVSLHGGGANVPGEEARSLVAPTRRRIPWGKAIDYAMGWTRRVPEDFDGIVCVGEDEYERYRERHPHVIFLPNGVDVEAFRIIKNSELRTKNGGIGQSCASHDGERSESPHSSSMIPNSILCVARIDRQKNQMMIVEYLSRHPGATARLVGPVTQEDYRRELEMRAAELGVADRLTIVGALAPGSEELLGEYARADVFVLPSRHEPFGIVVLEAWAAGVPVVASDVGGLGRLCAAHPAAAVTFRCSDAAAFDAAIGGINAEKALEMSAAGREAAREYDWGSLAARLVDFYGRI